MAATDGREVQEQQAINERASNYVRRGPTKLLIGGKWVEARSGATFETLNPATGEVLTQVACGEGG